MAAIAQHIGNYDILHEIGRGGMAVVYQAYDRVQRRVVALKVLPAYLAHDPDLLRRFLREGQESVALQHPNIVRTYEAGEAEGVHFIAMEYLPGGSVAEALARQGHAFDLVTATSIVSQVANALDYAHDRGVLHRDVKLRNILLDGRGRAVLSDFGIAKVASSSTLTPARSLIGTVHIMSPEQARGQPNLDRRSDVYALGVVLYEMLTGQPPFQGDHDAVIVHKILYEAPPAPRSLNSAIPPAVERVILTAMQKDRNKRYQTAGQLAAALQATMPAPTVTRTREPDTRVATPPRPGTPPPSTIRTGTSIWAYVLAGAGIVAALLIVLAVLALSRPPVQPGTSVAGTTGTVGVSGMASAMTTVTASATLTTTPEMRAEGIISLMQTTTAETAPIQAAVATTSVPATATPRPGAIQPTAAPQAEQLSPPVLTGPEDGWSAPIGSVTFIWNPVPNATGYIVETRSDRAGQTEWTPWPANGAGTSSLQLYYDANPSYFQIPGTVYYWRVVRLGRGSQRSQPSTERTFVFRQPTRPTDTSVPAATAQAAQLSPPVLTGPEDDWSAPIDSVTFTWNPVPGATGYIVETRSDRAGQTEWYPWPAVPSSASSLQLYYEANPSYFQIPGTVYYWRVIPLGRSGQRGQPSAMRRFEFQRPTSSVDTPVPTEPLPTEPPPTEPPPTEVSMPVSI